MALTDDQLAELKDLLAERAQTLATDVYDELNDREEREYGHLQDALPGDSGDQSVASTQADLSFRMTDRHTEELQAIARAQERMRDGSYGYCIDCGGEIGFERLHAYPTAERCILDQERVEKTYAHENKPTL